MLATLDDQTQLRIVANTLGGGELTGTQKQHIVDVNKRVMQEFDIQSKCMQRVVQAFTVNKQEVSECAYSRRVMVSFTALLSIPFLFVSCPTFPSNIWI
jgi:hypothetical protein